MYFKGLLSILLCISDFQYAKRKLLYGGEIITVRSENMSTHIKILIFYKSYENIDIYYSWSFIIKHFRGEIKNMSETCDDKRQIFPGKFSIYIDDLYISIYHISYLILYDIHI